MSLLDVGNELAQAARACADANGLDKYSDQDLHLAMTHGNPEAVQEQAHAVLMLRKALSAWEKASSCEAGVSLGGLPPSSQTQAPSAVQVAAALMPFQQHAAKMLEKDYVIPAEMLVLVAHLRDGMRKLLGVEVALPGVDTAAMRKGVVPKGTVNVPPFSFVVTLISNCLKRQLFACQRMNEPWAVSALLAAAIPNAAGPLDDEFWKSAVDYSGRPCGMPACECEDFREAIMLAADKARENWKQLFPKKDGGQANG
jgi:hypothetical protein